MFHKALRTSKSSPNLNDGLMDRNKRCGSPVMFKNLSASTECVNSPPFRNPHKALNDLYKKYSNGSSFRRSFSLRERKIKKLEDIYNFSNTDNTFIVNLQKSSRGLGMCIYGGRGATKIDPFYQWIRIGNLHPLQPAMECGKLTLGDVILEVNGTSMLGLTFNEAVEVLRNAPEYVKLKIFRPSKLLLPSLSEFKEGACSSSNCFSSCASSAPLCEEIPHSKSSDEIKVTLIKISGCLGFSIIRIENSQDSNGGIFVKALTREPAVSDGRIRSGDRILQVNGTDISTFTHSEAIDCLRNAPEMVTLSLCRSCNEKSFCSRHALQKIVHSFDVILDKNPDEKLGFALWDSIDISSDAQTNLLPCAAEVKGVYPGSTAQNHGIKVGDRILEVNGDSLLGKTAYDVVDILRKTNGVIRMVFCRL